MYPSTYQRHISTWNWKCPTQCAYNCVRLLCAILARQLLWQGKGFWRQKAFEKKAKSNQLHHNNIMVMALTAAVFDKLVVLQFHQ